MSYTSYTDLKTSVANYLGRSDLTSIIPDFISFAEIRMARELRTRKMLSSATSAFTAGDAKVALPSDFLQIRDLYVQGNARADDSGKPVFYTTLAAEFMFAPIPDSAYTLEILYYAKPTVLSGSNASNVFLANYADALLYASLLEAQPYLMDDPRIQTWGDLYGRAVKNIVESDENSEYSGIPLQMTVTYR